MPDLNVSPSLRRLAISSLKILTSSLTTSSFSLLSLSQSSWQNLAKTGWRCHVTIFCLIWIYRKFQPIKLHIFCTSVQWNDRAPPSVRIIIINNSLFVDIYHKHIVTGDLRIIKNNALKKLFIKGPKYLEVRPTNLEKTKRCILEGLHNCISSWYYENGVDKSFFLECINNVKVKIDERMSHLTNKLHANKQVDWL